MRETAQGSAESRVAPARQPGLGGLALIALAAVALTAAAIFGVIRVAFGPSSPSPVDVLMRLPQDQTDQVSLATEDPAEVARWLEEKTGLPVHALDLGEVGAKCIGAQAFPAARRGALHYETTNGLVISVYYLPEVPRGLDSMQARQIDGRPVRLATSKHPALSVVAWEEGGRLCFVSAAVDVEDLMPVAESVLSQIRPKQNADEKARRTP